MSVGRIEAQSSQQNPASEGVNIQQNYRFEEGKKRPVLSLGFTLSFEIPASYKGVSGFEF